MTKNLDMETSYSTAVGISHVLTLHCVKRIAHAKCCVTWLQLMSWSVQSRVRDAGTSGLAPGAGHHRHQGLRRQGGSLRVHAHSPGWMVSTMVVVIFVLTRLLIT